MKDFKDIQDLLNSTKHNKYAFVDYLLEYLDGDYHCLDFTVRSAIINNKDWSLKYKHLFSLMILKKIENSTTDSKDDVTEFLNSFVRDFDGELRKEKCQFQIDRDIEISVLDCNISELLEDGILLNLQKKPIESNKTNNSKSSKQRCIKKLKGKERSPKVLGTSYWGKLTVNSSIGEITKLIDANEIIPVDTKSSCITQTDDTSNENVFVRVDIYKGKDKNKLDIINSFDKTINVELHAADYLLSPFKQTYVRVTANVIISIDDNRGVKTDVVWNAERSRYTRDWVDTITPSNDEPFDYQNGLGGIVGG